MEFKSLQQIIDERRASVKDYWPSYCKPSSEVDLGDAGPASVLKDEVIREGERCGQKYRTHRLTIKRVAGFDMTRHCWVDETFTVDVEEFCLVYADTTTFRLDVVSDSTELVLHEKKTTTVKHTGHNCGCGLLPTSEEKEMVLKITSQREDGDNLAVEADVPESIGDVERFAHDLNWANPRIGYTVWNSEIGKGDSFTTETGHFTKIGDRIIRIIVRNVRLS